MRQFYLNEGSQTVEMLKKVKALGLVTSLDMAAIDPSSEAGAQDWKTILANVLPTGRRFWRTFFHMSTSLSRASRSFALYSTGISIIPGKNSIRMISVCIFR